MSTTRPALEQHRAVAEALRPSPCRGSRTRSSFPRRAAARTRRSTSAGTRRRRPPAPRRSGGCRRRPGSRPRRRGAPACPRSSSSARRSMNSSSSANSMIASKRALRLLAREPEHDRVDDHVVARGEIGVEADAELDERRQTAADRDLSRVDVVDPGKALEQRALAAAVAPDDPEELALR